MTSPRQENAAASLDQRWTAAAVDEFDRRCLATGCATQRDESLGRHTSMGVGGPTPLMAWPRHPDAVAMILEWCAGRALPWRVLGGGTNIMVADAGVAEPVINLTRLTEGATLESPRCLLPAGWPTAQALRAVARAGLGGLVWSTGLPGTIGGAAAGNAGCWGGEMADVVTRLDVVDGSGRWQALAGDDLRWSYRNLSLDVNTVIVAVQVAVHEDDTADLERQSEELQAKKRRHQPVGARNAGCIFKNPDADHAAGLLIDRAGCKGMRVGDASISQMHGNFLINEGKATSKDVDELIRSVTRRVREDSGWALEEEIHRW